MISDDLQPIVDPIAEIVARLPLDLREGWEGLEAVEPRYRERPEREVVREMRAAAGFARP